MTQEDLLN